MRLSMSTQTNLVCLSALTEPFPSLAGWDYSAGGAGDGAGKNLFVKAKDQRSLWAFYSRQHFAWISLEWMSNIMSADGVVFAILFKPNIFHA